MVIFTLATAAPEESVTVPSKVAFTACPITGAEYAKRIAPSSKPMLTQRRLIRPRVTDRGSSWLFIAIALRRLMMQAKKERESFSITHPTCFEEVRKEPKTAGTGSTP